MGGLNTKKQVKASLAFTKWDGKPLESFEVNPDRSACRSVWRLRVESDVTRVLAWTTRDLEFTETVVGEEHRNLVGEWIFRLVWTCLLDINFERC